MIRIDEFGRIRYEMDRPVSFGRLGPRYDQLHRGGRIRRYPPVAVGDTFGPWSVVQLLGAGHRGRSEMRMKVVCRCRRVRRAFESEMRKFVDHEPVCAHQKPGRKARLK